MLTSTTQQQLSKPKHKGKQENKPKHKWLRTTPIAELQQQPKRRKNKTTKYFLKAKNVNKFLGNHM
jgi:hypothetical protein